MAIIRMEAVCRDGRFIEFDHRRALVATGQIRIYLLANVVDDQFRFWERHWDWEVT